MKDGVFFNKGYVTIFEWAFTLYFLFNKR